MTTFPILRPHIPAVMAELVQQLDPEPKLEFVSACNNAAWSIGEVALRWMSHHSLMSRVHADAVIIGASSTKHLEQNLVDLEKGPLRK